MDKSFVLIGESDRPVATGCVTVGGPHHDNFAEVISTLRASKGIIAMAAATSLLEDLDAHRRMVRDGQRVIKEHRSAELVLRPLA